jgi:hypothetical protein
MSRHGVEKRTMDYASLPLYPAPPRANATTLDLKSDETPPTRTGLLIDKLYWPTIIVAALTVMGYVASALLITPEPPPQPFDFELVWERATELRYKSLEEVEAHIGPPTERAGYLPEFAEIEEGAERSSRGLMPDERFWHRWDEPKGDRWVAILYAGTYPEFKAWVVRRGRSEPR